MDALEIQNFKCLFYLVIYSTTLRTVYGKPKVGVKSFSSRVTQKAI